MEAGPLDTLITLQRAVVTKDEFNADVSTWVNLATVWASREDVRDSERFRAKEVNAEVTTRFQIRWSSEVADLYPADQLICDGRVYAISAVKPIGRGDGLEITAAMRMNTP